MIRQLAMLVAAGLPATATATDDAPLGMPDLPAYREALAAPMDGPTLLVTFRQLWGRPAAYRGRAVRVSGRVARQFRQPPIGELPALVEVWIVAPEGDPFCLVHPEGAGTRAVRVGDEVRFSGYFLKRLRYEGGDTPRLAPLIVGGRAPVVLPSQGTPWSGGGVDWAFAAIVGAVALAILAGRHGNRPLPRRQDGLPPPQWIEPEEPGAHGDARDD